MEHERAAASLVKTKIQFNEAWEVGVATEEDNGIIPVICTTMGQGTMAGSDG